MNLLRLGLKSFPIPTIAFFGLAVAASAPAFAAAPALQAEHALSICGDQSVAEARPRLCNSSTLPTRFELDFTPLPAGTGDGLCTISGPNAFHLDEALPVLVPGNSCVDLHLQVDRAAGMSEGEKACFQIESTDLSSDATNESFTSLYDGGNLCAEPVDGAVAGVPVGRQVPVTFTVYNHGSRQQLFDYQLEGSPNVSLDGGPAGTPLIGSVLIPSGGQAEISAAVSTTEEDPDIRHEVLLRDRDSEAVLAFRSFQSFAAGCVADGTTLCLNGGRFEVKAAWRDFGGQIGVGHAGSLTTDTGYFWFFSPNNVEVVLKVLDARYLNDKWWVYFGALSTVEYTLTVRDTVTGESTNYYNPPGALASVGDIGALPGYDPVPTFAPGLAAVLAAGPSLPRPAASPLEAEPSPVGDCTAGATVFCVQGGRFKVEVEWSTFTGAGDGQAQVLTSETGYFWFFSPNNIELVVKVLDGTAINGHWWVFFGALSDVNYDLKVTDTVTGIEKTYHNNQGTLASVADIEAFDE